MNFELNINEISQLGATNKKCLIVTPPTNKILSKSRILIYIYIYI